MSHAKHVLGVNTDPAIAKTPLVMLTSYGERGSSAVARANGIAAYLTKPVRQFSLFESLARVAGGHWMSAEAMVYGLRPGSVRRAGWIGIGARLEFTIKNGLIRTSPVSLIRINSSPALT